MELKKSFLVVVLLIGSSLLSGFPLWAQGFVSKVVVFPESNYCHLKFPAIREQTLYWDRPVLKEPSEGDVIDFYGPCDHDPLGKEEILRQRVQLRELRHPKGD